MSGSCSVPNAFWDRVSAHYDRQRWLELASIRTAVALLAPNPEDTLLDVGTGTGAVLRQLAKGASRPREALGVDLSAAMLEHVPQLPHRWRVEVADARALPFAADEFDAAVACYLLHLLASHAERSAVLAELRRVLRPGGRLVVVTPAVPARGLTRVLALALDQLAAKRPDRYGGLRALDPRPELTAAGFEILKTRWSTRGYVSICVLARRPARSEAAGPNSRPV